MKIIFNINQLYRITLGLFKPSVDYKQKIQAYYIVWPWMTEYFRTLQASEFPQMTDSARWEFAARTGLLSRMWKHRSYAVVGGQKIIYRRPIPIFSKICVTIQLEGFQGKWLFVKHQFHVKSKLYAVSWVKLSIRNRQGPLDVETLFEPNEKMKIPTEVELMFQGDGDFIKSNC